MYRVLKNGVDRIVALLLLLVLSPFFVLLLIATGLFKQQRLGLNARAFTVYKFKTMRNQTVPPQTDMQRLTPLGIWLRKWSIDEWPQLINVLKGEMSLVGPRPLPIQYDALIKGPYRARFMVKPGITGRVQVSGRNLLSWRQKFEYDTQYVENHGFLNDLKILLLTFGVVLSARGVDASEGKTMEEFKGFDR